MFFISSDNLFFFIDTFGFRTTILFFCSLFFVSPFMSLDYLNIFKIPFEFIYCVFNYIPLYSFLVTPLELTLHILLSQST